MSEGIQGSIGRASGSGGTVNLEGKTLRAKALEAGDLGIAESHMRSRMPCPIEEVRPEVFKLKKEANRLRMEISKMRDLANPKRQEMQEEILLTEQLADDLLSKAHAKLAEQKDAAWLDVGKILHWLMATEEGFPFWIWLSVREEYPEYTLERVTDILKKEGEEAKNKVLRSLMVASGVDEAGNSTGSTTTAAVAEPPKAEVPAASQP